MESTSSYQLKQGDEDYIFSLTLLEPNIKLSLEDSKGQIYAKVFSLEDIKSLDQIFSSAESLFDIVESFDNILRNEKVRVEEDESGLILIVLYITSEDRLIKISLNKEEGENIQTHEEKIIAFDENQVVNQIGENLDLNNANYEAEGELKTFDTKNVDSNINVVNNEFVKNEIQQNVENVATNEAEGFNYEEYFKNNNLTSTQNENEYNVNLETNTDVNINNTDINTNINADINTNINAETNNITETNYFQNTEEFTNINYNTDINANANIPQIQPKATESITNIESYENVSANIPATSELNINIQPKKPEIKYSLPFITRADDEGTTQNVNYTNQVINQTTTTSTTTNINLPKKTQYHEVSLTLPKDKKSEEEQLRINKLKGEQIFIKNQHAEINSKILELTNLINSYKSKISLLQGQQNNQNEINSLRAENQQIKQQLMELNKLRSEVAQAGNLRSQLSELDALRQKAAQVDAIKAQLSELNSIKMKLSQLGGLKDRFNELNKLKLELARLNQLKSQASQNQSMTQNITQETETKMTRSIIKGDIIHNLSELEMITRKINRSNNKITLNLLYKATADTDSAFAFHEKCDRAENSLVLIETDKGKRFGGFTSKNWRGDCQEKEDENAFLFSLDKMTTYDSIEGEPAIGCYPKFGPIFLGCQIRIFDNAFKEGGTTYEKGMNYETEEDFELTGGDQKFGVKEIEVYEVIVE